MDELIGLLEDKKEEVRVEASTAVAGLTGSVDGKQLLQTSGSKLFPVLLRLLHDESAKVTAQVYATLVNLSLDEGACRQLLTLGVVERVMEILRGSSKTGGDASGDGDPRVERHPLPALRERRRRPPHQRDGRPPLRRPRQRRN